MLKIRLRRVGARKQPSYRVVVADSRAARDGRFVEQIGHYNPRTEPVTLFIDQEKASKWIGQGAQPSESVSKLLKTIKAREQKQKQKQNERSRRVYRKVDCLHTR